MSFYTFLLVKKKAEPEQRLLTVTLLDRNIERARYKVMKAEVQKGYEIVQVGRMRWSNLFAFLRS